MNDDTKLKKLNELSRMLVLYVYSKIVYEVDVQLYDKSKQKLKNISDQIESLNNFQYPSNDKPTIIVCGHQLSPAPSIRLQMLYDQKKLIDNEINTYARRLNIGRMECMEFKSHIHLLSIPLNCDDLINYFDIDCVNSDNKQVVVDYIMINAINELEMLHAFNVKLSSNQLYNGTITTIKMIAKQQNVCELKTKEYDDAKAKTEFIQEKLNSVSSKLQEITERLNELQSIIMGNFLYKKEIEKLKKDFNIVNIEVNRLRAERYLKKEREDELKLEKTNQYYKYIKMCTYIDELIDKLGEKSLKELVNKLHISLQKTDNNYFNKKEELKIALKNWFDVKRKKIEDEVSINSEKISTSKQKVVRDGAFNRGDLFGK